MSTQNDEIVITTVRNDQNAAGVIVEDPEGDESFSIREPWAGEIFSGPHGRALAAWILREMRDAYQQGHADGEDAARQEMRRALGVP